VTLEKRWVLRAKRQAQPPAGTGSREREESVETPSSREREGKKPATLSKTRRTHILQVF